MDVENDGHEYVNLDCKITPERDSVDVTIFKGNNKVSKSPLTDEIISKLINAG